MTDSYTVTHKEGSWFIGTTVKVAIGRTTHIYQEWMYVRFCFIVKLKVQIYLLNAVKINLIVVSEDIFKNLWLEYLSKNGYWQDHP